MLAVFDRRLIWSTENRLKHGTISSLSDRLSAIVTLTPNYIISAFICSICFSVFLGYIYIDVGLPVSSPGTFIGKWLGWSLAFGLIHLGYSFFPKQRKYHAYNAFILVMISAGILVIGFSVSASVRSSISSMVTISVYTLGGPLWLLVFAWLFHLVSCGELKKPPDN